MKTALLRTGADCLMLEDLERVLHISTVCDQSLDAFRRMLMPLLRGMRGAVAVADDRAQDLLTKEEIFAFVRQVKEGSDKAILTAYAPRQHPYLYFAYGKGNSIRHIVAAGERQRGFRQQYPDVLCWWPVLAWFPEAERATQIIDACDFKPYVVKDPTQRIAFFEQTRHRLSLPGVHPCRICEQKPFESVDMISLPSRANRFDMRFIHIPASRCGSDIDSFGSYGFKVSRSFWIQDKPLTRHHWHVVMGRGRPLHGDPDLPETGRSLIEVVEFIKVLNSMGIGRYRLPRAHEWEYACRAGTVTDFFFDAMDGTMDDYAWYRENSNGKPHPVGLKRCNPWGLYDMAGNVREYNFDTYMPGAENGRMPIDPKKLVPATIVQVRGGGFNSRPDQLRSSHFAWVSAKEYKPNPSIGLRLVYISEDAQEDNACD